VTLRKNSDRVEVETRINNNIKDHRLRVVFPTKVQTGTFAADSVFDVVEYPVAIDKDNYKKKELQTDTRPQQNWTAISDLERGLAVISPGQYETAVSDDSDKAIKLTLFRSTRRTVMTSGEPNGQLLKTLVFKYWIMPVNGQADYFKLFDYSGYLANGIKSIQFRKQDIDIFLSDTRKQLPAQQGNLCVKNAVMTSLQKHGNDVLLRIFNPYDMEKSAEIIMLSSAMKYFNSAVNVDFEGNVCGDSVNMINNQFNISMKPKQIMTLHLKQETV
jgi:alpha-mannosidase